MQPTGTNDNDKSAAANIRLKLQLRRPVDTDDELSAICALLRQAGADKAERPTFGEPVAGRRGAEQTTSDVIATLSGSTTLLEKVLGALRKWLAGQPQRTVKATIGEATIELTGLSSVNEDRIVEAFIRHVCPEK